MRKLPAALLAAALLFTGCAPSEPPAAPAPGTAVVETLPAGLYDGGAYSLFRGDGAIYAAGVEDDAHTGLTRWEVSTGESCELYTFPPGEWLLDVASGPEGLLLLIARAEGGTALTVLPREGIAAHAALPETGLLSPRLCAGRVIAGLPDGTAALLGADGSIRSRLEQSAGARSIHLPGDGSGFCLATDSHWLTYSPSGEMLNAESLPPGQTVRARAAMHGGRYELLWNEQDGAVFSFDPDGGEAIPLGSGEGLMLHPGNGLLLTTRRTADAALDVTLYTGLAPDGRPVACPVDTGALGRLQRTAGIFPTREGFLILGEWLTPEQDTRFAGLVVTPPRWE